MDSSDVGFEFVVELGKGAQELGDLSGRQRPGRTGRDDAGNGLPVPEDLVGFALVADPVEDVCEATGRLGGGDLLHRPTIPESDSLIVQPGLLALTSPSSEAGALWQHWFMRPFEKMNPFARGAEVRVVTHEAQVAASPNDVWALVSDVERVAEWWSRATGGEVIEGEGVGRRQRVLMDWGRQTGLIEQTVTQWNPPRTYAWRVTKESSTTKGDLPPLADVLVMVEILPRAGISLVRITGELRPAGIGRLPALRQLAKHAKGSYKRSLAQLERALLNRR